MAAGLNYSQTVIQIAEMAVVSPLDINFLTILPAMFDYAENRLLRDLDLMNTSVALTGSDYALSQGNRRIAFPQNMGDGSFFVLSEQINLIMPPGENDPDDAERVALLPTTKEFLDAVYGSSRPAYQGQPKYFAPFDDTTFLVGPVPDDDYRVEVVGTIRPATLGWNPVVRGAGHGFSPNINFASEHTVTDGETVWLTGFLPAEWNTTYVATVIDANSISLASSIDLPVDTQKGQVFSGNAQSLLSQYFPDLLIMAAMVYISAYQRNFTSTMASDPQMPVTYETQYQALLKAAMVEESRKKYEAAAWSSQAPATVATPSR